MEAHCFSRGVCMCPVYVNVFWIHIVSIRNSSATRTEVKVLELDVAYELMLNNCEMSSVCVDTGVMWRLSDDFNRRFVARVHQSHHIVHPHHPHHHQHFRPASMAMFYNGKCGIILLTNTSGDILWPDAKFGHLNRGAMIKLCFVVIKIDLYTKRMKSSQFS